MKSNSNRGSSQAVFTYLEKEDLEKENASFNNQELPDPREGFFSHTKANLTKRECIEMIDSNKKGLRKTESKFYALTFSPSEKEQKELLKKITNKEIDNIGDLTKVEKEKYNAELQKYTRNAMNEYATNFERKKPLKDGHDLVYAAKIENNRRWKGTDYEVKQGLANARSGDLKPALNTHIHVVVSRNDSSQTTKLSPLNTRRKEFDRTLYKIKSERVWDKQMAYERKTKERVDYQIEASKNIAKATKAELTINEREKQSIEKSIVDDFDERNGYEPKDKQLSHEVEPSFPEKEQQQEIKQKTPPNKSNDYEIEY